MNGLSPNATNPWATLNTKILQMIFKHARYVPTDDLPEENSRPARPYYLGRVCQEWHGTIISTPSLWTEIIIYFDSNPTQKEKSLAESPLSTYFFRSAPHPVTVYLLRKVKVPQALDLGEKYSIQNILTALAPHSRRISGLFIEANTSSSLPSVSDLLSTKSGFVFRDLKCLMVASNCDDSHVLPPPPPLPVSLPALSTISLTYLNIDGRNLFPMLNPTVHLFHHLSQLEGLCINHLTPRVDGFSTALVSKLFDAIKNTLLRLQILGFDEFEMPSNATPLLPPYPPCSVHRLVIRKTASPSMRHIFQRITHPNELVLIGCFFKTPKVILPRCTRLVFERTVGFEHLPNIILEWDGSTLEFCWCKVLDDTFLIELHKAASSSIGCLTNLKTLKFLNCPGFSAKAIINLLEYRRSVLGHIAGTRLLDCLEASGTSPKLEDREQHRVVSGLVSGSLLWSVL